jgi:hypothetical protein
MPKKSRSGGTPVPNKNTYVVMLHKWLVYWDKKLTGVDWNKVPKRGHHGGGGGGEGGSPPPPKWPP